MNTINKIARLTLDRLSYSKRFVGNLDFMFGSQVSVKFMINENLDILERNDAFHSEVSIFHTISGRDYSLWGMELGLRTVTFLKRQSFIYGFKLCVEKNDGIYPTHVVARTYEKGADGFWEEWVVYALTQMQQKMLLAYDLKQ